MTGGPHVHLDDRLLHSEIRYAWIPSLEPDRVIVSSRLAWISAVDPSIAEEAQIQVVPLESLSEQLAATSLEAVMVLLGTVDDLAEAWTERFAGRPVVLANRTSRRHSRALSATFHATPDDLNTMRRLQTQGARFVTRRVPSEPAIPVDLGHANEEPGC